MMVMNLPFFIFSFRLSPGSFKELSFNCSCGYEGAFIIHHLSLKKKKNLGMWTEIEQCNNNNKKKRFRILFPIVTLIFVCWELACSMNSDPDMPKETFF